MTTKAAVAKQCQCQFNATLHELQHLQGEVSLMDLIWSALNNLQTWKDHNLQAQEQQQW